MSSSADAPDEKTVAIREILKSNPTNQHLAAIVVYLGRDVAGIVFAYLGREPMSWHEGSGILWCGDDIMLIEEFDNCFTNIRRCVERKFKKYRDAPRLKE